MSGETAHAAALLLVLGGVLMAERESNRRPSVSGGTLQEMQLPEPGRTGPVSLEEAIQSRRSIRDFRATALDLAQVSQVLWAAQGITDADGYRSAPSAGALYPLEVFLVAGAVEELPAGVYRYDPRRHALTPVASGDRRRELAAAAGGQDWIAAAPAAVVLTGVFSRTAGRYGERGTRYVHMEVGHAAQNVYLQAEALGLGTTMVGAFRDQQVAETIGADSDEWPLGILPIGVPR